MRQTPRTRRDEDREKRISMCVRSERKRERDERDEMIIYVCVCIFF